jgi:hypothetical protein
MYAVRCIKENEKILTSEGEFKKSEELQCKNYTGEIYKEILQSDTKNLLVNFTILINMKSTRNMTYFHIHNSYLKIV